MNRKLIWAGGGCMVVLLLVIVVLSSLVVGPFSIFRVERQTVAPASTTVSVEAPAQAPAAPVITRSPTYTPAPAVAMVRAQTAAEATNPGNELAAEASLLHGRYQEFSPGVVSIQAFISRADAVGEAAGSGFIIDDQGHIVTNNHVIEGAELVDVIFFNGYQENAEIIGTDPDSDLAVLRVDSLPDGARVLPLADSDQIQVGDWAVAIGNPFGLGSSMTLGIVSALGRSIPSGVADFSIPQAIQTDAAINPGNSGGPLLNLNAEVIGVNAQIRTGGGGGNTGVGFAIPANVVRHVIPTLIDSGSYQWPWLGVQGGTVNLAIAEANNLATQNGAYIVSVVEGSPAAQAGLRGSQDMTTVSRLQVPVGGDVVVAVKGEPIKSFNELLSKIAFFAPGDEVAITVLRDGQTKDLTVTLEARPKSQQTSTSR